MKKKLFFLGICAVLLGCIFWQNGWADTLSEEEFAKKRKEMVDRLIAQHNIKDKRVLQAILKVKRHKFVAEDFQINAYAEDTGLPIGYGQYTSSALNAALMTQALELKGDEKVLEIGTGSGYFTAILAELAKEVYSVEIVRKLSHQAKKRLKELGYTNIKVKAGDGFLGWQRYAPYDAIVVTVVIDEPPPALIQQLVEGGKIVFLPLVTPPGQREFKLLKKTNGMITQESITVPETVG